jgi:hypothetical protein
MVDASTAADGGKDAAAPDAGGPDTSDAAIDAPYAACFSSAGAVTSSLKACTGTSDCTYVRHFTNCCGSVELIGVTKASLGEVTSCEQAWDSHFPACGCFSNSVTTEDGKSDVDGAAPQVDCVPTNSGSLCQTFLP